MPRSFEHFDGAGQGWCFTGRGKDGVFGAGQRVFLMRQGKGRIQISRVGQFPGGEQENKHVNYHAKI